MAEPRPGALRLAVFDCDGTLVDSQRAIIASVGAAWAGEGLAPPPPDAIRRVVGLALAEAIATLAPDEPSTRQAALTEAYKDAFRDMREQGTADENLFPGIPEALDALEAAGWLLGVATGKSRHGLDRTLEAHGLAGRFVTLQTADRAPGKPHPAMLEQALGEAGVEASHALMIGDTTYDILMAVNAGVRPVGVAWGYHPADELTEAGAAEILTEAAALPACAARHMAGPPHA